jgi:protein SPA2
MQFRAATSQLFLQAPKQPEDQLPVSRDGGILDIHVTAFLTAIDALLTAGRSNSPTRVLTPMKAVVNAVTAILDDVRTFQRRASRDIDLDAVRGLQERCEATLANLVAASKTHAQSAGMSPVSLLDAAASHVSSTVTEIGKTVCIRKATKAEQDQFAPLPVTSPPLASNGFLPSLRSVEERPARDRAPSASSSRRGDFASPTPSIDALMSPTRMFAATRPSEDKRMPRPPSEPSSSNASSPPPIFDQMPSAGQGATSDDGGPAEGEGMEDAWVELKVRKTKLNYTS